MISTRRCIHLVVVVLLQALCYVHGDLINTVDADAERFSWHMHKWASYYEQQKKLQKESKIDKDHMIDNIVVPGNLETAEALTNSKSGRLPVFYQNRVMKREAGHEYIHTKLNRQDSALDLILVERAAEHRVKRTTHYLDDLSWPLDIPYVIDSSYSAESGGFYVPILHRVLKHISDRVCVTWHDETANRDPNNPNWLIEKGYPDNSYILVQKSPTNGCAASRGRTANTTMLLYPCFGFQITLHEFLHTIGVAHTQQTQYQGDYISLAPDNFNAPIASTFAKLDPSEFLDDLVDVESTMMYAPKTFTINGMAVYFTTRDEEFMSDSVISREDVLFKQLNEVMHCNELFCNSSTVDCGDGYYTRTYGKCACVCPRFYDPATNCQTLIDQPTSTEWPDVPMVLFKAGGTTPCPGGFNQTGWFSHTGIWPDLQKPLPDLYNVTDKTTYFEVCTKDGTTPVDWELVPPGGAYCIIKPVGVNCGFGAAAVAQFNSEATVTSSGTIGDTVINGNSITMKFCCSYQAHTHMVLKDIPNGSPFRLVAKGGCPIVDGMRSYKALVDFFTATKSMSGGVLPQYYIFANELQFFHCYYQPAVYGCHEEVTFDAATRSVTFQTPGYSSGARVPDKRCIYTFKGPALSQIRVTFHDYDLDFDDKFLIQRYNVWQEPYRLDYNNFPYQILSVNEAMYLEWWAGYTTVSNKGVNFTVDVLLAEEACYDKATKGADYVGSTSISENYEKCLPWVETVDCYDFPAEEMDAVTLLTDSVGSSCRNPGGKLERPWCYTYKNGTNCRRRFCDVCNYKDPVDVIKDCSTLIAADSNFCTDAVQKWGCFKSCNFQQAAYNECPEGWQAYGPRCYKYFDTAATRDAAESACNSLPNGGGLFEVLNEEDQQAISDYKNMNGHGSSDSWISGEYDFTNHGWFTTDMPTEMTYLNFPVNPECPAGWEAYNDRCFQMFMDSVTANTAAVNCANMGSTATLYQISNLEDQTAMRQYRLDQQGGYLDGVWVSGNLNAEIPGEENGDWRFTDTSTPMTYFNWTQFENPNNMTYGCIRVYTETNWLAGGWRAMACDGAGGTAKYMCQQDKPSTFSGADYIYMGTNGDWGNAAVTSQKHYVCQRHKQGTCAPPTIPSDGAVEGTLKPYYYVGERVVITCNNGNADPPQNEIVCLEDGWTPLAYACSQCSNGWEPYGNRCFQIQTDKVTCQTAMDNCRAKGTGGTMFRIHDELEQSMIKIYREQRGDPYDQGVWISGRIVATNPLGGEGTWHFTDSSTAMTYKNWTQFEDTNNVNRDCIRMYSQIVNGSPYWLADGWRTLSSGSSGGTSGYICQVDTFDVGCSDKITQCESIMTATPEFCSYAKLLQESENKCYKSCGGCPGTQCTDPQSSTYTRTSGLSSIEPGEYMTFECNTGLHHVGGDLKRACSSSGALLGVEPNCSSTPVATDVNLNSLRPRTETLPRNKAYLIDTDGYRVPFDGNITTWYYYADEPNPFYALVFRGSSGSYSYVGSNLIPTEADWPWGYKVPLAEQFPVLQGDIIGYFSTAYTTLFVSKCASTPNELIVSPRADATSISQVQTASFSSTECMIPSLGFRIEPKIQESTGGGGTGGGGGGKGGGGKKG